MFLFETEGIDDTSMDNRECQDDVMRPPEDQNYLVAVNETDVGEVEV